MHRKLITDVMAGLAWQDSLACNDKSHAVLRELLHDTVGT